MRAKVQPCLPYELRSEKRKAPDLLFTLFGYWFFHYRRIAHTEEKSQQKKKKVEEAKANCLFKDDNGESDFKNWRTADASKLSTIIGTSNIRKWNENAYKEILHLSKHEVTVRLLHEYVAFSVSCATL